MSLEFKIYCCLQGVDPLDYLAKYLAEIVVAGVRIVGRAFTKAVKQEYTASQAAANARSGSRGDGTKRAAADAYTGMTIQEAMQVLNLKDVKDVDTVQKNYEHLFSVNDKSKGGSFYIQSKVVRAKERLEEEIKQTKESETKQREQQEKPDT